VITITSQVVGATPGWQDRRVAVVSSIHFLLGPFVALCAMGVITLMCRWVFSTDHRVRPSAPAARDLGLLVPVATVRTHEDAQMLADVLREGGVRASISTGELEVQVLVFAKDADVARRLVSTP
jgi:hypothetical protein